MKFSSLVLVSAATLGLSGSLFAQSGPAIATLTPCNNAAYDCENVNEKVATDDVVHKISSQLYRRDIYKVPSRTNSIFVVKENTPVSVQRPSEFVVTPQSIGPGWMYITK